MPTILIPSGPDLQINRDNSNGNSVIGAQQFPQVAALPNGRFVIVYQSPFSGSG